MMVYSCNNLNSLRHINEFWYPEVSSEFDASGLPAIILVGNKQDTKDIDSRLYISEVESSNLAKSLEIELETRCSCLGKNARRSIIEVFFKLIESTLKLPSFVMEQPKRSSLGTYALRMLNSGKSKKQGILIDKKSLIRNADIFLTAYEKLIEVMKSAEIYDDETYLLCLNISEKIWISKVGLETSQIRQFVTFCEATEEIELVQRGVSLKLLYLLERKLPLHLI